MRSYCALYVDVGYLLASAATRVTGTSLRKGIHVEYGALIDALVQQAEEAAGAPVLRVHWYDSARDGVPDPQQQRIGELGRVKLRLGRFGVDGQQKGVDLRIGLDLVAHARNRAADVFFLVSGDDDLTEAVEEAQAHGVQVVVLAVPNADDRPHAVSRHLVRAADEVDVIAAAAIDKSVIRVEQPNSMSAPASIGGDAPKRDALPSPAITPLDVAARVRQDSQPVAAPAPVLAYTATTGVGNHVTPGYGGEDEHDDVIDAVVTKVIESLRQSANEEAIGDLERGRPSVPREIDRALLVDLSDALGIYDLSDALRYRLRSRFWNQYDRDA